MALLPGARTCSLDAGVHAAWSDASRGDLRPGGHGPGDGPPLSRFAGELAASTGSRLERVAWVSQVHGSGVRAVSLDRPSGPVDGPSHPVDGPSDPRDGPPVLWHLGEGDALVSTTPGVGLCVLTADCAPVALASAEGYFGAVHAGWRGLVDGVIEAAVDRLHGFGATDVTAALGPCIHAECYAFGQGDLDSVADAYGPAVRGRTTDGGPALDVPAGVASAVARAGARMVAGADACTACDPTWFSHRARGDAGRQALVVWSSRAPVVAPAPPGPDPSAGTPS